MRLRASSRRLAVVPVRPCLVQSSPWLSTSNLVAGAAPSRHLDFAAGLLRGRDRAHRHAIGPIERSIPRPVIASVMPMASPP